MIRTVGRSVGTRTLQALRPAPSVGIRFFCEEPQPDEKALQAIVDERVAKAQQTITPWFARDNIAPALKVAPVENVEETSAIQFTPKIVKDRKVIIYKPGKAAMQSATHKYKNWELKFPNQDRWVNPLMGWTSTADPMYCMKLRFETSDQAIAFAKKNGWDYQLEAPSGKRNLQGLKSYSHNFLPVDVESRLQKRGVKARWHFNNETGHQSTWQKTLKYHGDGNYVQHGGDYDYGEGAAFDPGTKEVNKTIKSAE